MQANVFVIDDDAATRQSVASVAQSLGLPCREFAVVDEFVPEAHSDRLGCLVLGAPTVEQSLATQQRLDATRETLPVIVLASQASVPAVVASLRHGAVTLLEKPFRDEELAEAIRQAMGVGQRARNRLAYRQAIAARLATLTSREQEVVELVMAGHSNKRIAKLLGMGQRSVERSRATILEKLGVATAIEMARIVAEARALDPQFSPVLPNRQEPAEERAPNATDIELEQSNE